MEKKDNVKNGLKLVPFVGLPEFKTSNMLKKVSFILKTHKNQQSFFKTLF